MDFDFGCDEYKSLSRRQFLTRAGMLTGAIAIPAWLPRIVMANSYSSTRDILVVVYLRGGADGLSVCPPHGDSNYYVSRPNIAIPPPSSSSPYKAIDLNGYFGMPSAFLPLQEVYQQGDLLFIHAAGSTDPTRSHFDAQTFMEVGKPQDSSLLTGWLGRHLHDTPPPIPGSRLRAISISDSLPQSLIGAPHTSAVADPINYGLAGSDTQRASRSAFIQTAYSRDTVLRSVAEDTQYAIDTLSHIDFVTYVPAGGADYGPDAFGHAMKACGALVRAEVGVEALHVNYGGWDTHAAAGPLNGGLAAVMNTFARAIEAFYIDMRTTNHIDSITTVVMSEFGRTVRENASSGTDHGHGNAMLLMGGRVRGGRVYANWPGIAPENLHEGQDLKVTTDYRDVLSEVLALRCENQNLGSIFPEYSPTFRGLVDPY